MATNATSFQSPNELYFDFEPKPKRNRAAAIAEGERVLRRDYDLFWAWLGKEIGLDLSRK